MLLYLNVFFSVHECMYLNAFLHMYTYVCTHIIIYMYTCKYVTLHRHISLFTNHSSVIFVWITYVHVYICIYITVYMQLYKDTKSPVIQINMPPFIYTDLFSQLTARLYLYAFYMYTFMFVCITLYICIYIQHPNDAFFMKTTQLSWK